MQRMTRQRTAVLEELGRASEFRSAQQVHEDLAAAGAKVGLATVYRNLQTLSEAGQVDTMRATDGEVLYRRCEVDSHHHHLVCRQCGSVRELAPKEIEAWVSKIFVDFGFTDPDHSIEISGICPECRK